MKNLACFIMLAMQANALRLHETGNVSTDTWRRDGQFPHMWTAECRGRMSEKEVQRPLSCYFTDCSGYYIGQHRDTTGGEVQGGESRFFWSKRSFWTLPIGSKYPQKNFAEGEEEFLRWGEGHQSHHNIYKAATNPLLDPHEAGFDEDHPTSMQYYMLKLGHMIYEYNGWALYMDWCDEDISADNRRWAVENPNNKDWDDEHQQRVQRGLKRAVKACNLIVKTTFEGVAAGANSAYCKAEEDAQEEGQIESRTIEMPEAQNIKAAMSGGKSHVPDVRIQYDALADAAGFNPRQSQ